MEKAARDATGGVLAQAGATAIFSDFPGAPLAGHWYHSALADAISGTDLIVLDGGPAEFQNAGWLILPLFIN